MAVSIIPEPRDSNIQISAIFVDLDGTLIATDLLHEAIIKAIRKDFGVLFRLPGWALRGRAPLKAELAKQVRIEAAGLPYRPELVDYLRTRKAEGCRIILATASPRAWAEDVAAAHDGLFDDVIASDDARNQKGPRKLEAIEEYQRRQEGPKRWGYVGDDHSDLCIWKAASDRYVVVRKRSVLKEAMAIGTPTEVFRPQKSKVAGLVKALRPHQWMKNILVFTPMIASHRVTDPRVFFLSCLAFVCFSLCASSIYVVNDLLDLDADRRHPKKRRRAFASGTLPVALGPPLAASLFVLGMTLSLLSSNPLFPALLIGYVMISTVYSSFLKAKPIIDVIVLAMLYTLRIFVGGAATGIVISKWLIAFSMFLFTSLAFAKRHSELHRLSLEKRESAAGRGYHVGDLRTLESMGITCGCMTSLVLALYIQSDEIRKLYPHPDVLWFVGPLLLYWISRLWLVASRGHLDEDPLLYATTDRVSVSVGALIVFVVLVAALHW